MTSILSHRISRRRALQLGGAAAIALSARPLGALAADGPINIGLSAAFSGPNAQAGEALQRGADLAIDDINAAGGVLGRKLALVTRDNEHKLERGVAQTTELIEIEKCAAIIGSQGSFIGLAVIDTMSELQVPWFGTATGGVGIIENGRSPNYMFRVATNDREVAQFLVEYGIKNLNSKNISIIVEDTGWGVPAIDDINAALALHDMKAASTDKLKVGDTDFTPQMLRARDANADTIVTFTNSVEMANALKAANKIGYKPNVISAWGLANANFPSLAGDLAEGVLVMQTFTFVNNSTPKAQDMLARLQAKTPSLTAEEIPFPSYIGNAYDSVHMAALAIAKAGTTEGPAMLAALEDLGTYDGVIKQYNNPFSADDHDALGVEDYSITRWTKGRLELVS